LRPASVMIAVGLLGGFGCLSVELDVVEGG
jgi:hypothetical protein